MPIQERHQEEPDILQYPVISCILKGFRRFEPGNPRKHWNHKKRKIRSSGRKVVEIRPAVIVWKSGIVPKGNRHGAALFGTVSFGAEAPARRCERASCFAPAATQGATGRSSPRLASSRRVRRASRRLPSRPAETPASGKVSSAATARPCGMATFPNRNGRSRGFRRCSE